MITAEDLQQPKGDVDPAVWFPGKTPEDVATLLDAYIADGVARLPDALTDDAAQSAAVTAYAMGRAARNVEMRLSAGPASFRLDSEGSQTIIGEQIKTWRQRAERYEAEWADATDFGDGTLDNVDEPGQGAAVNRVVW